MQSHGHCGQCGQAYWSKAIYICTTFLEVVKTAYTYDSGMSVFLVASHLMWKSKSRHGYYQMSPRQSYN
jgi:hypothetical protein